MKRQRWMVETKRADFKAMGEALGIDPAVARLMRNRGVTNMSEARAYLYGSLEDLSDPLTMKDMPEACDLLCEAADSGEHIRVIGDYDVDGVSSVYILCRGLRRIGASVSYDIPDRVRDGYGMNERLVEEAHAAGAGLILTCDNGVAAYSAVSRAKELGMKVVVTDHHEIAKQDGEGSPDLLPAADAVVDPHRADCAYPFKELCGAAVSLRLIEVLYARYHVPEDELDPLLEMAALATVADVMELTGENRVIVREGLKRMRRTQNTGLSHLMDAAGIRREELSAFHLGFVIGPSVNAAGRLESAKEAAELFFTEDDAEAERLALRLRQLNEARKHMTQENVDEAVRIVETTDIINDRVIVVCLPSCHESIAGIVAGKLRERYFRPVFVLTAGGDCLKGSGRSVPAYHMYQALSAVKDLLIRFGGHPMAAGLSLAAEDLDDLRRRLNEDCALTDADLVEDLRVDMQMPPAYLSTELVEQMALLEPCGNGNPEPLFCEKGLKISRLALLGRSRNVLRVNMTDASGRPVEAVCFHDVQGFMDFLRENWGGEAVEGALRGRPSDMEIAICYRPRINEWRGVRKVELTLEAYCRI